jgi:hypothetical protein
MWLIGSTALTYGTLMTLLDSQQAVGWFVHEPELTAWARHYRGVLAIITGCVWLLYAGRIIGHNGVLLAEACTLGHNRFAGHSQKFQRYADSTLRRARIAYDDQVRSLWTVPVIEFAVLSAIGECLGLSYGMTARFAVGLLALHKASLAASAVGYASLRHLLETPA